MTTNKHALIRVFLAILFTLFATAQASAAIYYVDAVNGKDTNPGSESLPWKHAPAMQGWSGVDSNPIKAGDTVKFKRGCTWNETSICPTVSGTAKRPITYTAYGTGADPIFTGVTTTALRLNAWSYHKDAVYSHYDPVQVNAVFYDNLPLVCDPQSSPGQNKWHWDKNTGLLFINIGKDPNGLNIEYSHWKPNIVLHFVNYYIIEHIEFKKNECLLSVYKSVRPIIRNCTFHLASGYAAISLKYAEQFVIDGCHIYDIGLSGYDHGIYLAQQNNDGIVSNNLIHDIVGGGLHFWKGSNPFGTSNTIFINNIIYNCSRALILYSNANNNKFYNNILFNNDYTMPAIHVCENGTANNIFRNNVIGGKCLEIFKFENCPVQDINYNIYWKDLSKAPASWPYRDRYIEFVRNDLNVFKEKIYGYFDNNESSWNAWIEFTRNITKNENGKEIPCDINSIRKDPLFKGINEYYPASASSPMVNTGVENPYGQTLSIDSSWPSSILLTTQSGQKNIGPYEFRATAP